jgi:hypothetical protein
MYAFPTDLAVVCASRCHIQTSHYHPIFSVPPTSDLNMSRNETLGYREYWEPHPDLDPILAEEAHKAIARLPLSHLIHPVDGEIFSAPEAALEIEAAKEQDEILEDTRTTRSAITIDNEDEEVTIDDLPPSSTAPAALGGRSKRARAPALSTIERSLD